MPIVTLKATPEFIVRVDQAADAAGESRSEYLRSAAEIRMNPPVIGADPQPVFNARAEARSRPPKSSRQGVDTHNESSPRPARSVRASSRGATRPSVSTKAKCPHPPARIQKGQCQACSEYVG